MTIEPIKQQQPSMIRFVNKSSGLRSIFRNYNPKFVSLDVKISDPRVMRASAVIWSLRPVLPALGHEAQRDLGTCDATQHLVGDNHSTRD